MLPACGTAAVRPVGAPTAPVASAATQAHAWGAFLNNTTVTGRLLCSTGTWLRNGQESREGVGSPVDDDAILEAIRNHGTEAGDALAAIQSGESPLTVEVVNVLAPRENKDPAVFWLEQLKARGLVRSFVGALLARGVRLNDTVLDDPDSVIQTERLQRFLTQAQAFRCRILKNGRVAGSGVLVGPSLILTSWHVIAVDLPGRPQSPAPQLEVLLADNKTFSIRFPVAFQSECGDAEYENHASIHDADVADRHDVALLEMVQPAATHLGHVTLASSMPPPKSRSRVVLVHFPDGTKNVIDFGFASKIRHVTSRWRHNVPTAGGSSGGACFDRDLQFLGIHQGQFDSEARFVPAQCFVDSILEHVRNDIAPPTLWSLDGTVTGPLVIGRSSFFGAIAEAGKDDSRVRGVRIKRAVIESNSTGLAFSHDILQQLLARRGSMHRLVRIMLDQIVDDLVADIRRRVRSSGLRMPEPLAAQVGIATGQAPPETAAKERAESLASAIEETAAEAGATVWIFIDNPTVPLTEGARLTIEAFVGAALIKPHLRLVIAGLETLVLPGAEFIGPPGFETDRSPGLVVEFIGEFRRADLLDLLTVASKDLTGAVDMDKIKYAADRALHGLPDVNGVYAPDLLATVAESLRHDLSLIKEGGR